MKLPFSHLAAPLLAVVLGGSAAAGCQDNSARTDGTPLATRTDSVAQAALPPEEPEEYLDLRAMTLNGKQPLVGSTAGLFALLGQPDSLVTPNMGEVCTSYYKRTFRYAHFRHSQWEIYGDTAVIGTITFRGHPEVELHTPTILLNQNTTLKALAQAFPQGVKTQKKIPVYGMGKLTAVSLPTGEAAGENAWILFFDEGKLVRIDYWLPC
ncbi:hypothetical protein K3G63_16525 [Hymenobacter sp. HSC-4F20]|uniref:hypothetical protein n=1 Tax=Hymenobacter sp. HSC-4F20 TaxID=2864135 RepID=UPI001C73113D|nr:hypothetical protein [Hymenobacter sp. HSC-4F20]MBX0292056.1 hypothetical protein [Hymenobacter sp. HSC-4F20]